jgi:hypothetical protein
MNSMQGAQSGYGLRSARRVLEQGKKVAPQQLISQEKVEEISFCDDSVWDKCGANPEADSKHMLSVSFHYMLD